MATHEEWVRKFKSSLMNPDGLRLADLDYERLGNRRLRRRGRVDALAAHYPPRGSALPLSAL